MPRSDEGPLRLDGQRVIVVCHDCGIPVPGGDGFLWVNMNAVRNVEAAWADFRHAYPDNAPVSVADMMDLPDGAPWRGYHARCASAPAGTPYAIDVDRIDTVSKLLSWTAHLMGKEWLRYTNWDEVLEFASGLTAARLENA